MGSVEAFHVAPHHNGAPGRGQCGVPPANAGWIQVTQPIAADHGGLYLQAKCRASRRPFAIKADTSSRTPPATKTLSLYVNWFYFKSDLGLVLPICYHQGQSARPHLPAPSAVT